MVSKFSKEEKQIIRENLLESGYKLLREKGIKRMKISDLAKSCDIAIGSFYSFFPSKEDFIVSLIKNRKEKSLDDFKLLADKYPEGIPFLEICEYFLKNTFENNIYRYIDLDEYTCLMGKDNLEESRIKIAKNFMSRLDTDKGVDEFLLFSECYKIIVIGSANISMLDRSLMEESVSALVKSACRLLY